MNLTDLTETARTVVTTMLCSACKGTGADGSTYVGATHLQPSEIEPCGKCWDHPGIDPDVTICVHEVETSDGPFICGNIDNEEIHHPVYGHKFMPGVVIPVDLA